MANQHLPILVTARSINYLITLTLFQCLKTHLPFYKLFSYIENFSEIAFLLIRVLFVNLDAIEAYGEFLNSDSINVQIKNDSKAIDRFQKHLII